MRIARCSNCNASVDVDMGKVQEEAFTIRCPSCGESFKPEKDYRELFRQVPLPAVRIGPFGYKFDYFPRTGTLCDISCTGMRIKLTGSPPKRGEAFNFQFRLPPDYEPITTSGRIVWIKKVADREAYESGVEFVGIDEENKKLIKSCLSQN